MFLQAETWLANKEAFLNNEDLGDSLSAVEALLQKHEAFEKTLTVQEARVDELEQLAAQLAAQLGSASGVAARLQLVTARRARLLESSSRRRNKLIDTRKLLHFLRNVYEVRIHILK